MKLLTKGTHIEGLYEGLSVSPLWEQKEFYHLCSYPFQQNRKVQNIIIVDKAEDTTTD